MASIKKAAPSIIIEDGSKLSALIKSIGVRGKKLDADIHSAACSVLHHAFTHKNASAAQQLMEALPGSARRNALKLWLLDMGCFAIKEDNKTWGIDKELHAKGFLLKEEALSVPFWKYSAEPEVQPLVAMDMVRKLIDKLNKAKGAGKLDAESITVLEKLATVAPAVITPDALPATA